MSNGPLTEYDRITGVDVVEDKLILRCYDGSTVDAGLVSGVEDNININSVDQTEGDQLTGVQIIDGKLIFRRYDGSRLIVDTTAEDSGTNESIDQTIDDIIVGTRIVEGQLILSRSNGSELSFEIESEETNESFIDDFNRSNRVLNGDNGWSTLFNDWEIQSNQAIPSTSGLAVMTRPSTPIGHWEMDLVIPIIESEENLIEVFTHGMVRLFTDLSGYIQWTVGFGVGEGLPFVEVTIQCVVQLPGESIALPISTVFAITPVAGEHLLAEFDLDAENTATITVNGETASGTLEGIDVLTSIDAGFYVFTDDVHTFALPVNSFSGPISE